VRRQVREAVRDDADSLGADARLFMQRRKQDPRLEREARARSPLEAPAAQETLREERRVDELVAALRGIALERRETAPFEHDLEARMNAGVHDQVGRREERRSGIVHVAGRAELDLDLAAVRHIGVRRVERAIRGGG
jgi:hypothetical protein